MNFNCIVRKMEKGGSNKMIGQINIQHFFVLLGDISLIFVADRANKF